MELVDLAIKRANELMTQYRVINKDPMVEKIIANLLAMSFMDGARAALELLQHEVATTTKLKGGEIQNAKSE